MGSQCLCRAYCGRTRSRAACSSSETAPEPTSLKSSTGGGTGLCLFTKRLEHEVFLWPPNFEAGETLSMNSAQLSLLLEGVDWRAPEQRWRPAAAG
jgi:hypothetical protein